MKVHKFFLDQSAMGVLKTSAIDAEKFPFEGTQQFCQRWSDNFYNEGIGIKDEKIFNKFVQTIKDDISALERQTIILNIYSKSYIRK